MTDEQRWMDLAEFRGETIEAMKAIHRELEDIKDSQRRISDKFDNHCMDFVTLKSKVAGMAVGISMVTSIVVGLIMLMLGVL